MPTSETSVLMRYHQLVQALASLARNSHQVEAVVQAVHQQAGTLFPSQVTLLALQQPDGDWLWELREAGQRFTQPVPFYPDGIMESVLHGEALAIPDLDVYLDAHPARVRRMSRGDAVIPDIREVNQPPGRGVRSMLLVPLKTHGIRAGVLSIQSYEMGVFDDMDLEFLQLLAQHVSIALENAALREELHLLTRTDALTGLHNRRAFYQDVPAVMQAARQAGRDLSLVMLDVHGFKRINDAHGHQLGDAVLATVGRALTRVFFSPNVAFRLGGDEFALLVSGPAGQLEELTTQLTHELRAADWPTGSGPVGLQGGVAHLTPEGGLDEWLSLADARMYHVKRRRAGDHPVTWGLDFGDVIKA